VLSLLPVHSQCQSTPDIPIPRADGMPRHPEPYRLIDWKQRARHYVEFVLDPKATGDMLPLAHVPADPDRTFRLPSYVGGDGAEAINCIAATLSGELSGLDMRHFRGTDWVRRCSAFWSREDRVYTNGVGERAGGSFWYDLFPNVLSFQLHDLSPSADARAQDSAAAEQWYRACEAMGGSETSLPNFDHTAFRFATTAPINNGTWIEPDSAAGIAWIEYAAWTHSHDSKFLKAADWCLRALQQRPLEKNPLYEVLLPYGVLTAARMNAELGKSYDVTRLLNWCFEPGDRTAARWGWGVIDNRFGQDDCQGLVGSVIDTDGYAFTMNTFEWAGALVPVARYDTRYARSIGRWMLNLTNAARLFYPDALPADHQDNKSWSDRNVPQSCVAYEGLRKKAQRYFNPVADARQDPGETVEGSYKQTTHWNEQYEVVQTGSAGKMEHIWRLDLPEGSDYNLLMRAARSGDAAHDVRISYASSIDGPFTDAFVVNSAETKVYYTGISAHTGTLFVKATCSRPETTLRVNLIRAGVVSPDLSPFATGDAMGNGAPSNLCLYGSSHIGILGAMVAATNVKGILQLNLLKTDYYRAPAYPTYLYYNPDDTERTIQVALGSGAFDLYDAHSHRYIERRTTGKARVRIAPDSALILVLVPSGKAERIAGNHRIAGGVVIDYHCR
jgi:hypothetical protein